MGLYQKSILFQETPPSLRATSFFPCLRGSTPKGGWGGRTEEELVIHSEDGECFNSPSVYRGKSASKREQTESLLVVCRARADSRLLAGSIPRRGEGV